MQYLTQNSVNKISNLSNIYIRMCTFSFAFLILFSVFFVYPKTANAGLFSIFDDIAGDEVSAQTLDVKSGSNSQNMALLQAAVNIDPTPHKNDDYNPITSKNAFIAEIGPQGTVSEIEDDVPTEISIYTVRKGDSLSTIADLFNVSVNTIVWANDISRNSAITEGQVLIILPISGIKYTAKKGDTIRGIVMRYKANLEEVLQYNDITLSTKLSVGDVIIIPDAEQTAVETPKFAKNSKNQKNSLNSKVVHDADGPYYPGYYIRPIEGGRKSQGLHGYNAVDLAASSGTVIRASAAGKVIASMKNGAWNGGYGNYVIISHDNGTQTLYAHNLKNFVSIGDTVEQGQMIAKVGNTGKSTGPHVHFEIRGAKNPF